MIGSRSFGLNERLFCVQHGIKPCIGNDQIKFLILIDYEVYSLPDPDRMIDIIDVW